MKFPIVIFTINYTDTQNTLFNTCTYTGHKITVYTTLSRHNKSSIVFYCYLHLAFAVLDGDVHVLLEVPIPKHVEEWHLIEPLRTRNLIFFCMHPQLLTLIISINILSVFLLPLCHVCIFIHCFPSSVLSSKPSHVSAVGNQNQDDMYLGRRCLVLVWNGI
eukprot:843212_1